MKHELAIKNRHQPEMETRRTSLMIKGIDGDGEGTFEGYGSVFNVLDSYDEIVAPGAFATSLAEHKKKGTRPAMLWQHDYDKPIGTYTEMFEDKTGLYVKGQLDLDTQQGREARSHLKKRAVNGLSIGFVTKQSQIDRENDDSIRTLLEVDLWEVSIVTFPANGNARVDDVKSAKNISLIKSMREAEQTLRDAGFSQREAVAMIARIKDLQDDDRDDRKVLADINQSSKLLLEQLTS